MRPKSRTKRTKKRVHLKLALHPGQREVQESRARFKVVACGRQWGKSKYASAYSLERMLQGKRGWWIAPDANIALIGWEMLKALATQIPGHQIYESHRIIEIPGGGWIQVKGAHLPGKLRARTLDFVVIDEAAFIQSGERWTSELQPTLAIRQGEGLFISTFNGENWFYDIYELGQSEEEPDWQSWRKPSIENPYFPQEELERARRTTPQAEFEQEYLANPLVYVGAVFPGEKVQDAVDMGAHRFDVEFSNSADEGATPSASTSLEGSTFAGLDWGYTNATAFEVCEEDAEGRIAWVDERSWVATQLDTRINRIVELCRERNIEEIYADAAGADENAALAAALEDAHLDTMVVRVAFGKFKDSGIKTRRWYLEQGLETMYPTCPELIRTTKRYRYKEGTEDVVKDDDHPVDASIAFYASRRGALVESR